MKATFHIFILLAAAPTFCLCIAQTAVDLRTQSKSVDFSSAASTRPFKTGTTLPATCSVGDSFFKSDATAGVNLYGCTAPGVWTALNSIDVPASSGQAGKVLSSDGTTARWTTVAGDVDGTPGANLVRRLQGRKISSTAPANNDVLQWNASSGQWEPLPNSPVLNTGVGIMSIGPMISVDDATVPLYLLGSGTPALTCDAGRTFYTNMTNQTLYFCGATNTWTPLSKFGHTHSAADITAGTFATSKITPGTDGQCLITTGGSTVWGPCPGEAGNGDVLGPASAEDYGLALYSGATGKQVQAVSGLKADAQGNVSVPGSMTTGNGSAAGEAQFCPPGSANCISWLAPAARATATKLALPGGDPSAARQAMVFGAPAGGVSSGSWQAVYAPGDVIASNDLPSPTAAAGGKVKAVTCAGGQFVSAINTDSSATCGAPAGGGGKYAAAFSAQTSITVTGAAHNLGTCDLQVAVYDAAAPGQRVEPDTVTCNAATKDVVIAFAVSQSGRYVIQ